MTASNLAAWVAGKIDTITVDIIEQKEIKIIDLVSISEGILLKK